MFTRIAEPPSSAMHPSCPATSNTAPAGTLATSKASTSARLALADMFPDASGAPTFTMAAYTV